MKKLTIFLRFVAVLLVFFAFSCQKTKVSDPENGQSKNGLLKVKPFTNTSTPNIIFILADDIGWDVFGNFPGTLKNIKAKTPTLDSLAKEGITFTNYYTNPLCTPTRASLLTGKYSFRTGVGNVQNLPTAYLKSNETIIQKYISDKTNASYATAIIGKWHVTPENQLNAPESFGAGYFSGILEAKASDYFNWTQTSGGVQTRITTYATSHLVNQSVNWIKQQTKPFFLWLTFNAPHYPFHRPPLQLIDNKNLAINPAKIEANPFPYYLASIKAMDAEIARLIASLTEEQKKNTVFIFTTDNGTPIEFDNPPYGKTKSKGSLFQGGINTPLIICGKGVIRKNVIESALAQAQDIPATIADIAEIPESATYQDGISLKPLFSGADGSKRTFAYTELFGTSQIGRNNYGYAIRNDFYKLMVLKNGKKYFFNLNKDRFENNNLFSSPLNATAKANLDQLRGIIKSLYN